MRVNDFFCGAGGMGLGFKQAGFDLSGAWDFDKWAVESYQSGVSPKVMQADISTMSWSDVPYADVWTFGFPCQDISIAGGQNGMIEGVTRSGLFYEIMRLLKETSLHNKGNMPKIILAENVKKVRELLPVIEKEYRKRGYAMYSNLLNTQFTGTPQKRERYFIIGVHESIKEEFVFPEQDKNNRKPLSSILEKEVDESFYIDESSASEIINQAQQRVDVTGVHACLTPKRIVRRQRGRRAKTNEEEMFTLTALDRHGVIVPDDQNENKFRVRLLTPRECARLQGFPDDYPQTVSDSQFYKQMGNAVTVDVARFVAKEIIRFLEDCGEV